MRLGLISGLNHFFNEADISVINKKKCIGKKIDPCIVLPLNFVDDFMDLFFILYFYKYGINFVGVLVYVKWLISGQRLLLPTEAVREYSWHHNRSSKNDKVKLNSYSKRTCRRRLNFFVNTGDRIENQRLSMAVADLEGVLLRQTPKTHVPVNHLSEVVVFSL